MLIEQRKAPPIWIHDDINVCMHCHYDYKSADACGNCLSNLNRATGQERYEQHFIHADAADIAEMERKGEIPEGRCKKCPVLIPPRVINIHSENGKRPFFDQYIGRHVQFTKDSRLVKDSKWHNPFSKKKWGERAFPMFEFYIQALLAREWPENRNGWKSFSRDERDAIARAFHRSLKRWGTWDLNELTNQVCGCWCIDAVDWSNLECHGQILIKLWTEKILHKILPEMVETHSRCSGRRRT